jgi:hypothetical protein
MFVNRAPNDGMHGMEPLGSDIPPGRFSLVALSALAPTV